MKAVISHDVEYRETVRKLYALLRSWNMGCYIEDGAVDDEQTITQGSYSIAILTPEQQQAITAIPGVSLK